MEPAAEPDYSAAQQLGEGQPLTRNPWVVFLAPFLLFMVFTQFEPTPPEVDYGPDEAGETLRRQDPQYLSYTRSYPLIYTVKIALVTAAVLAVAGGYKGLPWRITWRGPLVGAVGIVVWVGLCQLNLEDKLLGPLGITFFQDAGQRSAFNPLYDLQETPVWSYVFLVIRLFGLAVVVPVIEEVFLRGFMMRFVVAETWWRVPFATATRNALLAGTAFPMMMHLGELFAALVWFSMVTLLMLRTKSLGECVAAHAVTNLLLGFYVLATGHWELW